MQKRLSTLQLKILALALLCWAFYAFSLLFTEYLWATHAIAFLPMGQKIALLGLSLGCILLGPFLPNIFAAEAREDKRLDRWITQILLCTMLGSLCYMFPIYQDMFGDSLFIKPKIDLTVTSLADDPFFAFFSIDFKDSKVGLTSFFILVSWCSMLLNMNGVEVLFILEVVFAMIFAFAWFQAVAAYIPAGSKRLLLYLTGMFAPFTQMFYGHIESYAFEGTVLMIFFSLILLYFRYRKKAYLWALLPAFFLVLKLHITGWLMAPVFVLVFVYAFAKEGSILHRLFQWKNLFRYILLPCYLIGAFVYLVITESFNDSRLFLGENMEDFLFLPVLASDGPPLDRYNLFSFFHIWDYITLPFVWSSSALFVMAFGVVLWRKKINWNDKVMMLMGLAMLIYIPTFFCFNPLLSMPGDWDLMSVPAPAFLIIGLLVIAQLPSTNISSQVLWACLGLCIAGSSFMICNSQKDSLGLLYEQRGRYNFKSFWVGSSTELEIGINLMTDEKPERIAVLEGVVADLTPYATEGNDLEYAELLSKIGRYHFTQNAYAQAIPYFEKAFTYSPMLNDLSYHLVVSHFMLKEYRSAAKYLNELMAISYPNPQKAHRMALHVLLEAEAYPDALTVSRRYLDKWPEDASIQQVLADLKSGENLSQLKYQFRQK